MTNNTTSYGGDFTIKPLTTSIDIITERQLIASWTRAGLTDGQIRKMLMLYLGEPAWMNLEKMYTCNMFNNIAEGLKFHSKSDFIEILIRCKGFGFVWKDEHSRKGCRHQTRFFLLAFGNALHCLAVLSVISLASAGLPFQFRDVTMVIAI